MRVFWQQLSAAARVGWENESNWTRRWVFILYSAARPLALCLILFFLYKVKAADPAGSQQFLSIFVGSAFFTMIISITAGVSWVVIEDREHYQLIRYVYITPMRFFVYILGRSLPILAISISSLLIIWLFGWLVLGMQLGPGVINWLLLAAVIILGLVTTAALGILFAGMVLVTARHSMLLAEGTGAVFLLICGVLYPIDIMPTPLIAVAKVLPMTYWMELVRRSFNLSGFSPMLSAWSDVGMLVVFTLATAALAVVAILSFRMFENIAKKYGKLDQTTNY